MTELETLAHAKDYLDKLAGGIDPLSGQPVAESDVVNNVRVSRCLFYVSDVLRRVIENGGIAEKTPRSKKAPFFLSPEELTRFDYSASPIPMKALTERFNALIDEERMKKLKQGVATCFFLRSGFLEAVERPDGKRMKLPTEAGRSLGIITEEREGMYGRYTVVLYGLDAQRFLVDNVDALIQLNVLKLSELNAGE